MKKKKIKLAKCAGCDELVNEEELNAFDYCKECSSDPLYDDPTYFHEEF